MGVLRVVWGVWVVAYIKLVADGLAVVIEYLAYKGIGAILSIDGLLPDHRQSSPRKRRAGRPIRRITIPIKEKKNHLPKIEKKRRMTKKDITYYHLRRPETVVRLDGRSHRKIGHR